MKGRIIAEQWVFMGDNKMRQDQSAPLQSTAAVVL